MFPALALILLKPGTEYFGVYYSGVKAGHVIVTETDATQDGKPVTKRTSHMEVVQVYGGVMVKGATDEEVWIDAGNHPLREKIVHKYPTGTVTSEAVFGEKTVEVDIESAGKKSHKSVPLPKGEVLEDSTRIVRERLAPGKSITYTSFSGEDGSFQESTLSCVGPVSYMDGWRKVSATLSELSVGGNKLKMYTDEQGVLIRTETGDGYLVDAQAKEVALLPPSPKEDQPDMLILNTLHTVSPIENAVKLIDLKLRFRGHDLSKIPSDEFQTVSKYGDGWIVDIHPPRIKDSADAKIGENVAGQEAWLRPSEYLSSDNPEIREAAKKAIAGKKGLIDSVVAIRKFVSKRMKAKMEFGEVRDAADILKNPHGKCVEYAVLTTSLLRAAGIPSRVVSGLVTGDGTFFYHAWSEAWDGKRWIGIDAALEMDQLPAAYIKLAQGDADNGFRITYPPKPGDVIIDVLGSEQGL